MEGWENWGKVENGKWGSEEGGIGDIDYGDFSQGKIGTFQVRGSILDNSF